MTSRLFLLLSFALLLSACGVKNDLEIPNAQSQMDSGLDNAELEVGRDPSRPPQPLGQ